MYVNSGSYADVFVVTHNDVKIALRLTHALKTDAKNADSPSPFSAVTNLMVSAHVSPHFTINYCTFVASPSAVRELLSYVPRSIRKLPQRLVLDPRRPIITLMEAYETDLAKVVHSMASRELKIAVFQLVYTIEAMRRVIHGEVSHNDLKPSNVLVKRVHHHQDVTYRLGHSRAWRIPGGATKWFVALCDFEFVGVESISNTRTHWVEGGKDDMITLLSGIAARVSSASFHAFWQRIRKGGRWVDDPYFRELQCTDATGTVTYEASKTAFAVAVKTAVGLSVQI